MATVLKSLSALTPELLASTVAPAVVGDNSNVLDKFSPEILIVRNAIVAAKVGGLHACAYAAVLAWKLFHVHGYGKAEVKTAITGGAGPVSDKTTKRVHTTAEKLALRWTQNGLPTGLLTAAQNPDPVQSFKLACDASLEYLGANGITSQLDLEHWLNTGQKAGPKPVAETVAAQIEKAKKANKLSGADISAIAEALCRNATGKGQLARITAIAAKFSAELAKAEAKAKAAPKAKKPAKARKAKAAPVAKAA